MVHTYTVKYGTHKYRYYTCTNAQKFGHSSCPTRSVNSKAMEDTVINCLREIYSDEQRTKDHAYKQEIDALLSPVWDTLYPEEKKRILKILVKEIDYVAATKKLGITLADNNQRIEFEVDLKQVRPLNKWHKEKEIEKEPKIRRNLILAHQLQKLFDEGKVKNLKQASEWLNFDHVRLDHLMTMTLITPVIQNEILTGDNRIISLIPEYKVRSLAAETDWQKQAQVWQNIKETLPKK